MKTLHAKGSVIAFCGIFIFCGIIFILLAVYSFWMGSAEHGMFNIENFIICVLIGAGGGWRIYCTYWIRYGDGKIIVRRVSKKCMNGRVSRKWEKNEDEFLLEEIEAYGPSMEFLGHFVERYRISGRCARECFFQLKNGKRIGFDMTCYRPKETEELFRYIYEGTGIELLRRN